MLAVVVAPPSTAVDGPAPDAGGTQAALSPTERVAGMPLALRAVLTLQKEGVRRLLLLVGTGQGTEVAQVLADRRVTAQLTVRELAPGTRPEDVLATEPQEPFLLTPLEVIVDPAIYRLLLDADLDEASSVVAVANGRPVGPALVARVPADWLTPDGSDASLAARLAADEGARTLDVGARWSARADTPAGRTEATHQLFEACRKSVDGVVSRHLNRHISLFLSKRLVQTPLSPNGATIVTFLVGVVAAGFAMRGGYVCTLVGATLFQLNSILDGVDGELARVRFQQSKVGQWLDTIGDDAALFLFYAALAMGTRELPHGEVWSACAWIAAASTALSALLYYTELARIGSGDLYAIEWDFDKARPHGWRGSVVIFFRTILKQDFFVFVIFCVALFGVLHYALVAFATGGVITVVAAAVRRIQNVRKARAAAHG